MGENFFMKVIKEMISKRLDENQSPEYGGFHNGFSTMIDHILTIEKAKEYRIELHCFVVFRKAFDMTEHKKIRKDNM